MERNLRKIMMRMAGICLLLMCVLLVPQRALAIGQVSLKQISRPGEIDTLMAADEGMLFYSVSVDNYFSFAVPERGWVFLRSNWDIDLYANASITQRIDRKVWDYQNGMQWYGFYLDKSTYYIKTIRPNSNTTCYGYFLPSSSVLKVNSSLSADHTSAMLNCTSTIGSSATYSWVKDVSIPDNIQNDWFYSQKNILGEFPVSENGTYSVRVTSSAQEWSKYPVDIHVTVEGIVEKTPECNHNFTTIVDKQATCGAAGSQHQECTLCGLKKEAETIPATNRHNYGDFVVTKKATVLRKGEKIRTCTICGAKDTESIPELDPSMTINASNLVMKKGQSTTKIKVSGLVEGDYVTSWKSSNTKVVKVNNKGKITARKIGRAEVTVTLASELQGSFTVTVQNSKVATERISGVPRKLTIQKGRTKALKPDIYPITSQDKVTYRSSNTKIATVSGDGIIKARKAGKAKITVTSGKKKVTVTVTVKK